MCQSKKLCSSLGEYPYNIIDDLKELNNLVNGNDDNIDGNLQIFRNELANYEKALLEFRRGSLQENESILIVTPAPIELLTILFTFIESNLNTNKVYLVSIGHNDLSNLKIGKNRIHALPPKNGKGRTGFYKR
ncbi:MAG: hypothetical protein CMJ38_00310 [Phycisphaerae bacterium]|nr:hypothetical protein [Phycisphaerae bacterium]